MKYKYQVATFKHELLLKSQILADVIVKSSLLFTFFIIFTKNIGMIKEAEVISLFLSLFLVSFFVFVSFRVTPMKERIFELNDHVQYRRRYINSTDINDEDKMKRFIQWLYFKFNKKQSLSNLYNHFSIKLSRMEDNIEFEIEGDKKSDFIKFTNKDDFSVYLLEAILGNQSLWRLSSRTKFDCYNIKSPSNHDIIKLVDEFGPLKNN